MANRWISKGSYGIGSVIITPWAQNHTIRR